jgi:hypothetical protein
MWKLVGAVPLSYAETADTAHAASRIHTGDPQPAEFALLDPAVAKGVNAGADQRDRGLAYQVMTAQAEAFGRLAKTCSSPHYGLAVRCSRHSSSTPDLESYIACVNPG